MPRSRLGDERGNVTITFAGMSIAMLMMVGGAVDIGRWLDARTQTIAATDAAVLAGARALQLDPADIQGALDSANRFYQENTVRRLPVELDTIGFKTNQDRTEVTATGTAYIRTSFLMLAGIDRIPLVKLSGTEYSTAKLAVGGKAATNIEMSLMLDVTGSMSGHKLADLKIAAKDLIDIVIWDDQSEHYAKIALAPFSQAINLGDYAEQVVSNGSGSDDDDDKQVQNVVDKGDQSNARNASTTTKDFVFADGYTRTWKLASNCATERTGPEAFTDAKPTGQNKVGQLFSSSGSCLPSDNPIVPLTNDKTELKDAVDNFVASGWTAGHLGTAWAWYLISPEWGTVFNGKSKPAPYSDLTEPGVKGQPKLKKIAVLMTDGEYNTQYCSTGIMDRNADAGNSEKGWCYSPNGSSAEQAAQLCTNMKKSGIEVYTVGFDLGSNRGALELLRACATNPDKFYQADSGENLKQAFRDIALQISQLYLSK